MRIINVLIVDDSPIARELLIHILSADPKIHIVGAVSDGQKAIEVLGRNRPDVITMDIIMPKMNGFEATRRIMELRPAPIVIVSASCDPEDVAITFRAVEAGAVAVVEKPRGRGYPDHEKMAQELVRMVKLMSEVKVVRRRPRLRRTEPLDADPLRLPPETGAASVNLVALGSSTGGPLVLQTILSKLPKDFAAPLLVVQHIAPGFLPGMVKWLAQSTELEMHIAAQGEILRPAHVYLAPDGLHLGVDSNDCITLSQNRPEYGLRPAVSYLFRSVAEVYGPHAAGVLLTGMGRDGAQELRLMKDKGAVTIVQDKESSVVYGMPGEALQVGAATYVLSPESIVRVLQGLVGRPEGGRFCRGIERGASDRRQVENQSCER